MNPEDPYPKILHEATYFTLGEASEAADAIDFLGLNFTITSYWTTPVNGDSHCEYKLIMFESIAESDLS